MSNRIFCVLQVSASVDFEFSDLKPDPAELDDVSFLDVVDVFLMRRNPVLVVLDHQPSHFEVVFEGVVGLNTLVVEHEVVLVLVDKTQQVFNFHAHVAVVLVCLFSSQTWQLHSDSLPFPLDIAAPNELVDSVIVALHVEVIKAMAFAIPSHRADNNLGLDWLNLRWQDLWLCTWLNHDVRISSLEVLGSHLRVQHVEVQHLVVLHQLNCLHWVGHRAELMLFVTFNLVLKHLAVVPIISEVANGCHLVFLGQSSRN